MSSHEIQYPPSRYERVLDKFTNKVAHRPITAMTSCGMVLLAWVGIAVGAGSLEFSKDGDNTWMISEHEVHYCLHFMRIF